MPVAVPASAVVRSPRGRRRTAAFAWAVLAYTVFVVLFGAVVRITGSGAGCGQHWPSCQGELVHLPRSLATGIELLHRLTSGLSLVLVVALLIVAYATFPPRTLGRRAAVLSLALLIVEALLGAALVLFALVDRDASLARALLMPVHLVNTSLLTGALLVVALAASMPIRLRAPGSSLEWWLVAALAAVLLVSMSGAVTALGDTLYPMEEAVGLAARVARDQSPSASLVQRLRVLHPALAVLVGVGLLRLAGSVATRLPARRRAAWALAALVVLQLAAGMVNVALGAPGWLQVVHLALAVLVWLVLVSLWVLTSTAVLDAAAEPREPDGVRRRHPTEDEAGAPAR